MIPRGGFALRYALWHARDYAIERAPPSILVSVLLVAPTVASARAQGAESVDLRRMMEQEVLAYAAVALVLFAVHGVVALDRETGLARVYYVRPVNVAALYLQKWIVNGVLMLALATVGCWVYGRWLDLPYPKAIVLYAGVAYLLLGGLGFLASVYTRFDSGVALLCFILPRLAYTWVGGGGELMSHAIMVFPPAWLLDTITGKLVVDTSRLTTIAWSCGYGVAAVCVGVRSLRRPRIQ